MGISRNDVFSFIIRYKSEHDGNSPTVRKIRDELDISSTSVVNRCLDDLERQGKIRKLRNNRSGSIEVVNGIWFMTGHSYGYLDALNDLADVQFIDNTIQEAEAAKAEVVKIIKGLCGVE